MRNPSGFGTVKKLSGKRRKPYAAMVSTGAVLEKPKDISFLRDALGQRHYEEVYNLYHEYFSKQMPKAINKQKLVGTYATRKEALIALADYQRMPVTDDISHVTFAEVYDTLLRTEIAQMKPQTAAMYKTAFNKCKELHNRKMSDLKTVDLQRVIDSYADYSKGTNDQIKILFNMIYRFCIGNDILEKNYAESVRVIGKAKTDSKQIYSPEEIEALWNNLSMPEVDTVLIALYTGARVNEVLALKVEDIDLKSRIIDLKGTKNKNAKRLVPIHQKIIPLIESRIANAKKGELFYYPSKGEKYIHFTRKCYSVINEQLGQKHTIHETRHTFISYWKNQMLNPSILKKIVGHAGADITEDVYTHFLKDSLVQEIDKLII